MVSPCSRAPFGLDDRVEKVSADPGDPWPFSSATVRGRIATDWRVGPRFFRRVRGVAVPWRGNACHAGEVVVQEALPSRAECTGHPGGGPDRRAHTTPVGCGARLIARRLPKGRAIKPLSTTSTGRWWRAIGTGVPVERLGARRNTSPPPTARRQFPPARAGARETTAPAIGRSQIRAESLAAAPERIRGLPVFRRRRRNRLARPLTLVARQPSTAPTYPNGLHTTDPIAKQDRCQSGRRISDRGPVCAERVGVGGMSGRGGGFAWAGGGWCLWWAGVFRRENLIVRTLAKSIPKSR